MSERWDAPVFDKDLILKYDRPGPRYTSLPDGALLPRGLRRQGLRRASSRRPTPSPNPAPLSLYFHLPFCKSVCYFCGCNVTFTKDRTLGDVYVDHAPQGDGRPRRPHEAGPEGGAGPLGRRHAHLHPGARPGAPLEGHHGPLRAGARRGDRRGDRPARGHRRAPRALRPQRVQPHQHGHPGLRPQGAEGRPPHPARGPHPPRHRQVPRAEASSPSTWTSSTACPTRRASASRTPWTRSSAIGPDRIAVFNFAYLPEMIGHQRAIPKEALPTPAEKLDILEMVVERFTADRLRLHRHGPLRPARGRALRGARRTARSTGTSRATPPRPGATSTGSASRASARWGRRYEQNPRS